MPSYNDAIVTAYGPTYGPGSVTDIVSKGLNTVVASPNQSIADKQQEVIRATGTMSIADFIAINNGGKGGPGVSDPNFFGV